MLWSWIVVFILLLFFFFKQKTAYEMRISDWSSDVCSSDLPLHSGDREDRGGNDRVTDYGIVPNRNLHSIWDSALAERAITSAQPQLVRRYSDEEHAALAGGNAADWGRESWQAARDFVYPNAFDRDACAGELPGETALTQEDIVLALPVAQRRIQQAGLRIADLLESAFAPGPLPETERR